jgi:hypothetical protein
MKRLVFLIIQFSLLVMLVVPVSTQISAAPLTTMNESFTQSTAPGWVFSGSACLTASVSCVSVTDSAGSGWLRLTDAANGQTGSAIYNTAFSSADGNQISFDYADYGGNGADGFTFYLIDGATTTPTTGGSGSGLGYARAISVFQPGVTNGYLGIGFDEWGNFETADAGACDASIPCLAGVSGNRQFVGMRGSGNLNDGFTYLGGTTLPAAARIDNVDRTHSRRVRITLTPGPDPLTVSVEMDFGSGFVTIIDKYNLPTAPNQVALPATFKMGFSASTGGYNNIHEIRNLTAVGARTASVALSANTTKSMNGQTVTIQATVTGSGATPSGTVNLFDGATNLGTLTLNNAGTASSNQVLALGAHTLTAVYSGDSVYGSSTSLPLSHEVSDEADLSSLSVSLNSNTATSANRITFSAAINQYADTIRVNNSNTPPGAFHLIASVKYPSARLELNGVPKGTSISEKISINEGDNTFTIKVTSASSSSKVIMLNIKGEPPPEEGVWCIALMMHNSSHRSTGLPSAFVDNFNIQVYYDLRDKILNNSPKGRHYIDLYYKYNADIINALAADPTLWNEGLTVLQTWAPILAGLFNGQGSTTTLTLEQVEMVKTFLNHLSDAGSPELKDIIDAEETSTPLDQFVGMTIEGARASQVGYTYFFPTMNK